MKKTYRQTQEDQELLFPPHIGDLLPKDHVTHFLRKLVKNELDLRDIKADYSETRGAPPYPPHIMVSLLLYGFMKGETSSRRISGACGERVDFMYISGMSKPDFRTICLFRRRHSEALEELFEQVLKLCREAGLVKMGHVSIDGTRIKANASMDRNMSYKNLKESEKALKGKIKEWFKKCDEEDDLEDRKYGKTKRGDEFVDAEEALELIKKAKKSLEKRDKKAREKRAKLEEEGTKTRSHEAKRNCPRENEEFNFTDSDSRRMRSRQGFIQGYNSQIAVDAKSYVIVSNNVSSNNSDNDELKPLLRKIFESGRSYPQEISADGMYSSEENLRELENLKIRGYVSLGCDSADKKVVKGSFRDKMRLRLKRGGKRRSKYRFRKMTVEPVFGVIKEARGFKSFLLRGLQLVKMEWSLVCTAHNLWKLFKIKAEATP